MQLVIAIEGFGAVGAELDDTSAARDFVSLLPLSLTLQDYAATEKVSDLPRRLSTDDAPAGCSAEAGDLTYYVPWGNLAIFHKHFQYVDGLVKLGWIAPEDVDALRTLGPLKATIRKDH
ncbi:cyclophilin-like fold protein [Paraburkholderia strydomiana]|uniref:cyclophilin-like fold protein n=1 Tax=Paraburkholderia strydomiana TaxID=1245417 RepID=UPI0038B86A84